MAGARRPRPAAPLAVPSRHRPRSRARRRAPRPPHRNGKLGRAARGADDLTTTRDETIRAFLADAGWGEAARRPLAGDASTRRYERLSLNGRPAVLMDWPSGPDAPVMPGRAAYSRIAHLAEDVRAFVAVGEHLRRLGLTAPELIAADLTHGLLLLEDLGDQVYGLLIEQGRGPSGEELDELYRAGVETLIRLQSVPAPEALPIGDGTSHQVPHFDDSVFRAELDVPLDWYFPAILEREATPA